LAYRLIVSLPRSARNNSLGEQVRPADRPDLEPTATSHAWNDRPRYDLKRCASMELLNAVHEVLRGRPQATPLITKDMLGELPDCILGSGAVSGELVCNWRRKDVASEQLR